MAITAAMVKDLREMTGAGMMDCKKALTATDGDMDKSVEFLREKGLAAAEKKAGRIAAEGICSTTVSEDGKIAAIVEVNSETDFVSKNETFRGYVAAVVEQAAKTSATDIDTFLAEPWELEPAKTVKEELSTQISIIGENMNIRRFQKIVAENGFIESYIHAGGRIGVLVEVESTVFNDATKEAAKNVAMQIAAIYPKYVNRSEISADYIEHEREILKAQAMNEDTGKPESIIDKMIVGRLNKQLKEVCLVDQAYVKDGDLTVQQYLDNVSKEVGATIAIKSFVRYETGEGLAKKEENFAEEVARQMGN
jgi:elongation factor Ts